MVRLSQFVAVALIFMAVYQPAQAEQAVARKAMVATVHPLATQAGVSALRSGGNAVDAAVAAALTLGVVDGHNSGIGGGCFILIRRADGRLVAIDGRETAPARAHRDMYLRGGEAKTELSQFGALASGVPGALAAYDQAIQVHGSLQLRDLLLPAAKLADDGFAIDRVYAASLEDAADRLQQFSESARVLLKEDGSPYKEGEQLRLPDLAATYRAIAEQGVDWFYRGPFAQRTAAWMAGQGGIMTAADFATYQALEREPLITHYRGYTVVGFPPPSSGGVHVAQILNILEHFEPEELHREQPAVFYHVLGEAMKLAFADRAYWLGDPDFAKVPKGLVSPEYAAALAKKVKLDRSIEVTKHGVPPRWQSDVFRKHTTHIAAADDAGNWVAITATVNTTFGSKVIIPGTGVVMNNEMDDFSIQPGVPNAFGLIGAEANAVAPGKRPLSSMSPTIVLRGGEPVMTVGAAGGPKIITQVVLAIVNHLDRELELPEAVAAPRIHHQWRPDQLFVDERLEDDIVQRLRLLGHDVQVLESAGITQAISAVQVAGEGVRLFVGVHDPRVPGSAAGLD